ncbi:hypothetical protein FDK12_12575 [Arthrobacter sp. NamB2]|uniref:hypothetical protein n=1 Tax=Arthrobacter sp. NamB2 TaxID=2576035 RepID=UPI0010C96DFE|nr:hypothetical protein [Arthrobacter sp. NamB2]TKV26802.1 hypothetical protein FDK12_12575 [Arthrobacter sp. NamB2]
MSETSETNPDQEQYALTYDAMKRANIPTGEVWLHYFSMGGGVDEYEVNAYLHGLIDLPDHERDCISQAVNELFDDLCRQQGAPYSSGHTRHCSD